MESGIKVIDKAFKILKVFNKNKKNISLKELSQITGQNKSTIIRICNSLIKHDFLFKNEINGLYQLGSGCLKMSQIFNSNFNAENEIKEVLREICNKTGQSSGFWIRTGNKKVCLYRINSTESELTHYLREGASFPLVSATGIILKAFGDNNKILMEQINKKGYVFTSDERINNIASVAVPAYDNGNIFKGSLNVSGWKQFFTPKLIAEYAKILKDKQIILKKLISEITL